MPILILPCAKCDMSTPHRTPKSSRDGGGEREQLLQCDMCGTIRPVPPGGADETSVAGPDVPKVLAIMPAMSQKQAHARLEELLYEYRAAIEGSEAFHNAVAATNASEFETQDIKVQKYQRGQGVWIADFNYYALGESDDEMDEGEAKIVGTGVGTIDDQGQVEISDVTAAVAGS